jgi:hypothetical protein
MTEAITNIRLPHERSQAMCVTQGTLIPVGNHLSGSYDAVTAITLEKPYDAQFLKIQALTSNLRYRIDSVAPTSATGFQLTAGSDVLVPVAVTEILIIGEGAGSYEAQWVR